MCCLTLAASYLLGQPSAGAVEEPAVVEASAPGAAREAPEPAETGYTRAPAAAVPTPRVKTAPPLDAEAEPFDPERGVPPGYHLEQGVRKWLVLSGAGLFGVSYGLSFVAATGTGGGADDRQVLLLPLAGPFIYLAANAHDTGERLAWAVVGAGQLVGATAFIMGLAMKTSWIVPDERSVAYVGPMQIGHKGYGGGLGMRF